MPVFLKQFLLSGHSYIFISCDDLISQPTDTSLYLPCVSVALCISQNRLDLARTMNNPLNLSSNHSKGSFPSH